MASSTDGPTPSSRTSGSGCSASTRRASAGRCGIAGSSMAFSFAILIGTGVLYHVVPKGFLPSEDTGRINATTEAAQGTSFEEMVKRQQQQVAAIVAKDTNIDGFMSAIGGGGGANNVAQSGPPVHGDEAARNQRLGADQFIQELRGKLSHVPGHDRLSVQSADDSDRRSHVEGTVPVHDAERRYRRALPRGAEARRPPRKSRSCSRT